MDELEVAGAGSGLGAAEEKRLSQACGVGRGDVGAAIADQERLRQIQIEVAGGAEDHPRGGLAIFVLTLICAETLGMVGAVVGGGKGGVAGSKLVMNPGGEGIEVGLGVDPAANPRLIGDDNEFVAEVGGATAQGEDVGNPFDILDTVEVMGLLVNDAVAVEKESWSGHSFILVGSRYDEG